MYQLSPQIDSGIKLLDSVVNGSLSVPVPGTSMNPLQLWVALWAAVPSPLGKTIPRGE